MESGNGYSKPGSWKSEPGNGILEPRSQKSEPGSWKLKSGAPGTFWEVEGQAALQGSSKSGPRDPLAQYINRCETPGGRGHGICIRQSGYVKFK